MQSKTERNKKAKIYQRKYRKEHADKVFEYNHKTIDERSSRNKARRKMIKKLGKSAIKNMEVHHKNRNPKNNSMSNLSIRKKGHGGGPKKK